MSDFEGELVQIDYRTDGTIEALHAVDGHGGGVVIRLGLPPEPMERIGPAQRHAVFMQRSQRPTVSIESEREDRP